MWKRLTTIILCVVTLLVAFWLWRAPAYAAPYVSCPGGYIAPSLADCPRIPEDRGGQRVPHPAGGGGNPSSGGGLLGDLLGRLGLGGLGGLL